MRDGKSNRRVVIFFTVLVFAVLAVIFTGVLLARIKDKMNSSANEALITSSRMIKGGIESRMESDEELLATFSGLLVPDESGKVKAQLQAYSRSSDFFNLIYLDADGRGVDSFGNEVRLSDLPFLDTALSEHKSGITKPYNGDSGHVQIAYQRPVEKNGTQVGAIYAEKILNNYKSPALFSFSNGNGRAYLVNISDGAWLIEGRSVSGAEDIYGYLECEKNDDLVCKTLRQLTAQGKSGTVSVRSGGAECLLCFLPMEKLSSSYLISIIPKTVLQREASTIMGMIRSMVTLLLAAGVFIVILLLGRQAMKATAAQKEYREKLFSNLSANIDFAFLLYTPAVGITELVSDNIQGILGPQSSWNSPEVIFERCGLGETDADRRAFLEGTLDTQVVRECMTGTGINELKRFITLHLIPADNGQFLLVLNDSTKDHHMKESLADALEQARSTSQAKTVFFSAMSHDLRTPMNGIIGMSNIALSNLDNEAKVRSCLNKILTASDHLLSLINEILDMSRIESGKLRLKEEEVHLPSMIASILEFINPEVERKSLELQMKSQVLEYDTVLSDSLHLQKILLNLLSNAVKYTPEGGKISLKIVEKQMRDGKMQICFVVADSGIGMTQEFMERIFQPFERAEDSRSSRIAGTGLGMAIVKSIVDMMGGEIRVESRTGQGSTFTVTLPMKYVSGEVCGIQELTGVPVLIADDEQDACESLSLILTEAGVNADWVLSGEDAVARVRKAHEQGQDFYAVILDWKMPTMDGIETARLIREITGNRTTILLLSAYDWENVEEEAIRIGINGFLTKPIFKNQLLRKLKHYARYHTGNGAVQVSPWEMRDGPDLSRAKILIAEDNELNLEIITEFLTSYGARVVCAGDGSEAVRCFQESAPGEYQMIFMDIHMPKMDGLEAARCIRASSHPDAEKVPIIAMTADVFSKDTNIFETAGMDAYVGKPINIDRLIEVLYEFSGK